MRKIYFWGDLNHSMREKGGSDYSFTKCFTLICICLLLVLDLRIHLPSNFITLISSLICVVLLVLWLHKHLPSTLSMLIYTHIFPSTLSTLHTYFAWYSGYLNLHMFAKYSWYFDCTLTLPSTLGTLIYTCLPSTLSILIYTHSCPVLIVLWLRLLTHLTSTHSTLIYTFCPVLLVLCITLTFCLLLLVL